MWDELRMTIKPSSTGTEKKRVGFFHKRIAAYPDSLEWFVKMEYEIAMMFQNLIKIRNCPECKQPIWRP